MSMNIKIQKLITLFNERKKFFNNHPSTYAFLKDSLGNKLPIGTEITISVQKPGENAKDVKFKVEEIDKKFIDSLSDILN